MDFRKEKHLHMHRCFVLFYLSIYLSIYPSIYFCFFCAACSVTLVVSDSVTPWTAAHQAPLSMGFSWQEYWQEWAAISSSRGSSWPRDRICIFCMAGRFFTSKPPSIYPSIHLLLLFFTWSYLNFLPLDTELALNYVGQNLVVHVLSCFFINENH